jgi:diguanylate cyclase (GGDEF)-like protein
MARTKTAKPGALADRIATDPRLTDDGHDRSSDRIAQQTQCDEAPDRCCGGDRQARRETVLLMIDIDHFKEVNDSHGHESGDLVLKALATTLHRRARMHDIVSRTGGEEFLVICARSDFWKHSRSRNACASRSPTCESM